MRVLMAFPVCFHVAVLSSVCFAWPRGSDACTMLCEITFTPSKISSVHTNHLKFILSSSLYSTVTKKCIYKNDSVRFIWICVCVLDAGWGALSWREGISLAEPSCLWLDVPAGVSLADGYEHGSVHTRVQHTGHRWAPASQPGQWQTEGEPLKDAYILKRTISNLTFSR